MNFLKGTAFLAVLVWLVCFGGIKQSLDFMNKVAPRSSTAPEKRSIIARNMRGAFDRQENMENLAGQSSGE
ncbi:MAG: hypothetical protein K2X27_13195 [Candidatus Obscuribacterales bacterium]|nr:hypothetical protein [Candidatus Obscuribacterales bacterium]